MKLLRFCAMGLVGLQLSACTAPTFRNAVFLVDKDAPLQVLEPKGYLPPSKSPIYQQVGYRYPPASVLVPSISEPWNPFDIVSRPNR